MDSRLDFAKRLLSYSAAGAAAALTAGTAQGAIIANTTPQNFDVRIGAFAGINYDSAGANEFEIRGFQTFSNVSSFFTSSYGIVALYQGNPSFAHIEDGGADGADFGNPNALPGGFAIGAAGVFDAEGADTLASTFFNSPVGGPFEGFAGEVRYVGTRFQLGGNTHYGWIGIQMNADLLSGVVTGYAYEACADGGIAAGATSGGLDCGNPNAVPEPSSLALLATGAAGLMALRRRKG